jgi:vesicle coat complex subunit
VSRSLTHYTPQLSSWCRYASEVDVDFVRKSVKAIGQAAIKIEEGAERCVNVLLDLIATRVSYVVQEAVVVMKVSPKVCLRFEFLTIVLGYL